jgi:hypothetical protein
MPSSLVKIKSLVKKRKLWKKYRYNKNPQNKTKYEEARTEANRLVRKAKYEYERTIAINMKEDNKIFWKFTANLCHRLFISPWANFTFQSILFNCALIFS